MFIYCIENIINNKIYIGKTVDPKTRWNSHQTIASGGKSKYPTKFFAIHAAIAKYGSHNFMFNLIEHCADNDNANEIEKYWIKYLKDFGLFLYNETPGGDGMAAGTKFSEKHKRNISIAKMGHSVSLEARNKMSKSKKFQFSGEKNNKSKITENKVREIRQLYLTGKYTHRSLGKLFNLTHANIGKIIRCELWPHVH